MRSCSVHPSYADAHCNTKLLFGFSPYAVRQLFCILGAGLGRKDGKLLATDPSREVILPKGASYDLGEALKHSISGRMTSLIVYPFKVVEVQEEKATGGSTVGSRGGSDNKSVVIGGEGCKDPG